MSASGKTSTERLYLIGSHGCSRDPARREPKVQRSTWTLMLDALPSELSRDSKTATRHPHVRLIVGAAAALIIMGAAFVWRVANGPPPSAAPVASVAPPAHNQALEELVEATKALQVSQQQAIDQLQVLQEQ